MDTRTETATQITKRLRNLAREARRAEAELAEGLLEVQRRRLFRKLGYARIGDYAEAELDLTRAKTKDLLEIAARAPRLPAIGRAFREGELCWTKARQLVRIATPETEEAWIAKAEALRERGGSTGFA